MPWPEEWPGSAGRVPTGTGTEAGGGPFPLQSLSFHGSCHPRAVHELQTEKGFGAPLLPLRSQMSPQPTATEPGAALLPPKPAAQGPYPLLALAGAWTERLVSALPLCSRPASSSLPWPPAPCPCSRGSDSAGPSPQPGSQHLQGREQEVISGVGPREGCTQAGHPGSPRAPVASPAEDGWGCLLKPPFKGGQCPFLF